MARRQSTSMTSFHAGGRLPDGADQRFADEHVIFGLRAPSHVLCAEIPERLLQRAHFFKIADHQRERGLEMSLQRREIRRKEPAQLGSRREQLRVEAPGERARLARNLRKTVSDARDRVGCHNGAALA